MQQNTKFIRYVLLGMWLSYFLMFGLRGSLGYAAYMFDLPVLVWIFEAPAIIQWFVAGVIITLLLAITSRPLTGLVAARLTALAGFVIVLFNYLLDLQYGRYGFFGRFGCLVGYDGLEEWIQAKIEYPGWVGVLTFLSLGYFAASYRGLRAGIVTSVLVAFVQSVLGWLALAIRAADIRLQWELPLITLSEVMAILVQASLLAFLGVVGAMLTRFRPPSLPSFPLHKRRRRYRPARRIASGNRAA